MILHFISSQQFFRRALSNRQQKSTACNALCLHVYFAKKTFAKIIGNFFLIVNIKLVDDNWKCISAAAASLRGKQSCQDCCNWFRMQIAPLESTLNMIYALGHERTKRCIDWKINNFEYILYSKRSDRLESPFPRREKSGIKNYVHVFIASRSF